MNHPAIIERLKQGNAVYLKAQTNPGNISQTIRQDTFKNGQHPDVIVITCADSRVIPEAIFSAGIGELFTIRVAGNVIGPNQLGSVEYAAGHLHSKVIIVLGHTACGAIGSTLAGANGGYVEDILKDIRTAIGGEKDPYRATVLNARHGAAVIREKLKDHEEIDLGSLDVLAAIYHIDTGAVEWL